MKNCVYIPAVRINNLQNYLIGKLGSNLDESIYVYVNENNKHIYDGNIMVNLKYKKLSKS